MTAPQIDAILTVPLTSRAQEIEAQIDTLDRRVLLAALLFILAGAGIGYSMAERIADPGESADARDAPHRRRRVRCARRRHHRRTNSAGSSRISTGWRAISNGQRAELERTNRLEAWAEMARQVAHEIKNPLTPIQLNAEHLRRVNADRGEPLSPILEQSVSTRSCRR